MSVVRWFRSRLVVRLALTLLGVSLLPLGAAGYLIVGLTERSLAEQVRTNQRELAASSAVVVEQYVADAQAKLKTMARLVGNTSIQPRAATAANDATGRQALAEVLNALLDSGEGTFLDLKYFHYGTTSQEAACQTAQRDEYIAAQKKQSNRSWQGPEEQRRNAGNYRQMGQTEAPQSQAMDVQQQQLQQTANLFNESNGLLRNMDTVPDRFDPDALVFAVPRAGSTYVSPTIGLADDIPFLAIAAPVSFEQNKGKGAGPEAVLIASVDFRPLLKRLARLGGAERAIAINDGLTPLAASAPPTGPDVSSSTTPFGTGQWTLTIHESRESAFAPLRAARLQATVWVGTAGGLSILASLLLAGWILRPVRRLTHAAHRMGGGDLSSRAGVDRPDEIGELARAFDRMAAALQELDLQKSDFVSHVSHELRTPLTSIKLSVANLMDGVVGPLDARQQEVLVRVRGDLDRLIRMVNELLDIAKLDAGKVDLARDPVDLAGVARDAAAVVSPMASGKGVKLSVTGEAAEIPGDRAKLTQVAINLIDNAVKFTPEGGSVAVEVGPRRLVVRDTGCGIAAEALPRIFEKFAKVGDSRAPRPVGAGLGLSITRRLVELHGGTIRAESEVGKGSTFTVTF